MVKTRRRMSGKINRIYIVVTFSSSIIIVPGNSSPALKSLREMGFISSEEKEGKTIAYTLTESGKRALRISKRRFIRTFLGVFP
jgi:DNA-binding PadR family transcriptional regulator